MLGGRRVRMVRQRLPLPADADFCIVGTVDPQRQLPEGPFGDHLGYYSLAHDFPVLKVEQVYHRPDAIWPFTVVGRPPQEDTSFGAIIHELTEPMVPISSRRQSPTPSTPRGSSRFFAIGSERYVPQREREPRRFLTCANAILGFGQCFAAKYLSSWRRKTTRSRRERHRGVLPPPPVESDFRRDLHFQTRTTIDTLDYSAPA
jgi:4-hydroxy-3-polyprenylbenzoate decarboxylase